MHFEEQVWRCSTSQQISLVLFAVSDWKKQSFSQSFVIGLDLLQDCKTQRLLDVSLQAGSLCGFYPYWMIVHPILTVIFLTSCVLVCLESFQSKSGVDHVLKRHSCCKSGQSRVCFTHFHQNKTIRVPASVQHHNNSSPKVGPTDFFGFGNASLGSYPSFCYKRYILMSSDTCRNVGGFLNDRNRICSYRLHVDQTEAADLFSSALC